MKHEHTRVIRLSHVCCCLLLRSIHFISRPRVFIYLFIFGEMGCENWLLSHALGRTHIFYFKFCKFRLQLRQLPCLFLFHAASMGKCYCSPDVCPYFLNRTISVCRGWAHFVYVLCMCAKICRTHTQTHTAAQFYTQR